MLCSVLGSGSSFIMSSAKDDTWFYERNIFKIQSSCLCVCLCEKTDEGQRRSLGMPFCNPPLYALQIESVNNLGTLCSFLDWLASAFWRAPSLQPATLGLQALFLCQFFYVSIRTKIRSSCLCRKHSDPLNLWFSQ